MWIRPSNACRCMSQDSTPHTSHSPSMVCASPWSPRKLPENSLPASAIGRGDHPAVCTRPSACTCRSPLMSATPWPVVLSVAAATTWITPADSILKATRSTHWLPKAVARLGSSASDTRRNSFSPLNRECHPITPARSTCEGNQRVNRTQTQQHHGSHRLRDLPVRR